MDNTPLHQRLRNWASAIAIVATLVAIVFLWLNHTKEQNAQKRAAMANTEIVYVADPVQKLVKRADGSYYKTTLTAEEPNAGTYEYTTVEDHDVVVPKSVSVTEQGEQPQLLRRHLTFTNDIEVRIIGPHEADRTPRLERLRCTVKPIDASKPSYTGDPHAAGRLKLGPDQEGTDAESLSGLFSNGGQQLCQDRITILVPDGSIQP
ncbi:MULTISPECIES: hypothetical protein [Streptomyces]|uniref:hypothetical protein n=1 Tax=Streptomyces TaxID=1883 RepID=UPI0004CD5859|nr:MULTISPECIES: hypothetical protein [Streptomyces]KOT51151.1 hypothetical protein ADK43_32670 [Streptomyces rimosus subsp. rimosus]